MPRKHTDSEDSASLQTAIETVMERMGRGGLSFVAREVGLTPSALQKRLKNPAKAFDAPTLRAALLIVELKKAEDQPLAPAEDTPALPS